MRSTTHQTLAARGWRRAVALSLSTAVLAPLALAPAAHAADTSFEAESMTAMTLDPADNEGMWPQAVSDSAATGGKAFKFGPDSTASKTLTTTSPTHPGRRAGTPGARPGRRACQGQHRRQGRRVVRRERHRVDHLLPVGRGARGHAQGRRVLDNNYYEKGSTKDSFVDSVS